MISLKQGDRIRIRDSRNEIWEGIIEKDQKININDFFYLRLTLIPDSVLDNYKPLNFNSIYTVKWWTLDSAEIIEPIKKLNLKIYKRYIKK